jgi:hypothetical protein
MSSAASMSRLVTGQLGNKLLFTMWMNSRVVGRPIFRCNARANSARDTSALVYLVLFSLTVLTSTVLNRLEDAEADVAES